jgi:SMI1 / KNR4 family (SUKH-1)
MPILPPQKFVIGQPKWADAVRRLTGEIGPDYWDDFRPLSSSDIGAIETALNRRLPNDFKQFLLEFGSGKFPDEFGGNVYSPQDILAACHGPLLMQLGSAKWASDEAQRGFYISHGRENPDPKRFTTGVLTQMGFSLLDLLQIGTDGSCGYHQLFVGEDPAPFGYCLLLEDEVSDKLPSFSEALFKILSGHWHLQNGGPMAR